jgi:hypothetical protein
MNEQQSLVCSILEAARALGGTESAVLPSFRARENTSIDLIIYSGFKPLSPELTSGSFAWSPRGDPEEKRTQALLGHVNFLPCIRGTELLELALCCLTNASTPKRAIKEKN